MGVLERCVHVEMHVGFMSIPRGIVVVPMMLIVRVHVLMRKASMEMPMHMPLGHMQPDAGRHQRARDDDLRR